MNESIAQANGHQPIERPTDRFAEEMLRPLVADEVARQLPVTKPRTFDLILHEAAWAVLLIAFGFMLGGLLS